MKNRLSHIAFGLLLLFTVSFVPFNLLHHHAEEEHVASLHNHELAETRHCELDDLICNASVDEHCGHAAHLHKTKAKCFACEFHFIKHFEGSTGIVLKGKGVNSLSYQRFVTPALHKAIIRLSNKGPPVLA